MTEYTWLAVYSVLVLLVSLCGGFLPFLGRVTHERLQFYLSASAGVMLGAAFFHVMPEAMEYCGSAANFGWWMSLGVVGLFCIERFIAPHSHELDGGHHPTHHHGHGHHEAHGSKPAGWVDAGAAPTAEHPHAPVEHRAVAPPVAGWAAVLGLTIHT